MKKRLQPLVANSFWVIGGFGLGQVIRLLSSVILARVLGPEILGVMVLVNAIRSGVELLSDVGIQQSIVSNKNADQPDFYNTAWTVRLLRGFVLFGACAIIGPIAASVFDISAIALILPVVGLTFLVSGFGSLGPIFLQRQQRAAKLSIFELFVEAITAVSQIAFALLYPSIWAIVVGLFANALVRALGSYVLVPHLRHRLTLKSHFVREIMKFGIWFFVASLVFYFSSNFDRLYLGAAVPLEVLGVYGIARSLVDVLNLLFSRLNFTVIFPFITSHSSLPRDQLRLRIERSRLGFLALSAIALLAAILLSDLVVAVLFDARYRDAGWILGALLIGTWFSALSMVGESVLLGVGKPSSIVWANFAKLACLVLGFFAVLSSGRLEPIVVILACSELVRFVPFCWGQRRERLSFFRQDLVLTCLFFGGLFAGEYVRFLLGFGISFMPDR